MLVISLYGNKITILYKETDQSFEHVSHKLHILYYDLSLILKDFVD